MKTTKTAVQSSTTSNTGVYGYALLDKINTPEDLKTLNDSELKTLSSELRQATIEAVSKTGGHLGAGLGVVELTTAIHAVFDTPHDRLIWDVGHQCYPHKILTGRKDRIKTLRQGGGLSGFTKRSESEYDPFGAAHSSTSISAGLGMAVAAKLNEGSTEEHLTSPNNVICVIGDGSISAGMAYEAMNNAGSINTRLIVILNDNDMSIAQPVGAMSKYLTRLVSSKPYNNARDLAKSVTKRLPSPLQKAAKRAEEAARTALGGGTLFEELGFYYIGPIDGHNMDELLPILRNIKNTDSDRPILIHAKTTKGKGYAPAESAADKMHGVATFDVSSGQQNKPQASAPSFTKVFADQLVAEAKEDTSIVGITAAMPGGTGMDVLGKAFPDRMFDVGIAEQHGVTFAAGMATEGLKPFVSIYSTFLQRGYDQVVHDIALQNLPVRLILDRAGLVGADGQTHAGSFDVAYLGCLPNMMIMAPSDEIELARMTKTAALYNDGPCALRYPRGNGYGITEWPNVIAPVDIGKGQIIQEGDNSVAVLSFGTRLQEVKKAAETLKKENSVRITIADARFAKPLDTDLIDDLVKNHSALITIEEGSRGGFGSFVLHYLSEQGHLDNGLKIRTMHLPDRFQDHDKPDMQYKDAGLDADSIKTQILRLMS